MGEITPDITTTTTIIYTIFQNCSNHALYPPASLDERLSSSYEKLFRLSIRMYVCSKERRNCQFAASGRRSVHLRKYLYGGFVHLAMALSPLFDGGTDANSYVLKYVSVCICVCPSTSSYFQLFNYSFMNMFGNDFYNC